jgi:hypothetical protein
MDTPKLTICPPATTRQYSHFDNMQFASRRSQPVEAHYVGPNNGENGWASTGISFGDYGNMQTQAHKQTGVGRQRRLETPAYMLDEARRRRVFIRFLELRAGFYSKQQGTEQARLARAEFRLKQSIPRYEALLDECALDYVTNPDDAQRRRLQRRIEEYDTTIRVNRDPSIIPTMARVYYFEQLDSVGVAQRFGLKSPQVRQILYRLTQLDAVIQAGTDGREKDRSAGFYAAVPKPPKVDKPLTGRGRRSAHVRYHVHRGITSPTCAHCSQGAQNLAIGARRTTGNESAHVSAS